MGALGKENQHEWGLTTEDQPYLCSTQGHCEETESNMEDGQEEHENVQLMHAVGWNKRHHALPPSLGLAHRWTEQSRIVWRLSTDEAKSKQHDDRLSVYPYIHTSGDPMIQRF